MIGWGNASIVPAESEPVRGAVRARAVPIHPAADLVSSAIAGLLELHVRAVFGFGATPPEIPVRRIRMSLSCPTCGAGPFADVGEASDHEFTEHPEQFERQNTGPRRAAP